MLRDWPRTITIQGIVWPLCVIGCMAEAKHQYFFESLLAKFVEERGAIGNISAVLRILKGCWASQEHREGDGLDFVFQAGVQVLLI